MKKSIVFGLFWFFSTPTLTAQDSIQCSYYPGKSRIYFLLENTSSDTISLSWKSLYASFRDFPELNIDYRLSKDTFFINLADYRSFSNMKNEKVRIPNHENRRLQVPIAPSESYGFYMKVPKAKKVGGQIQNILLICDSEIPPIKSVRLKNNSVRINNASQFLVEYK